MTHEAPTRYALGPMTVGDIIGRGFGLLFSRFGLFYGIMVLVELPILALQLALPDLMVSGGGTLLLLLPTVILQAIGTGALIRVVMQEYLNRPVGFGESLRFAVSRLGPLIGTSILSGLIIFLGTLACLIPGIYFAIVYSLASQVVIVEGRAGMDALGRSKSLVDGHFGRVFGILFLVGLCVGAASGAIAVIAGLALPYEDTTSVGARLTSYPNYAINMVLTRLTQVIFQALTAICTTLIYFDLRNRKEAFDLALEADRVSAWAEHFRPQPHAADSGIQAPDAGVQSSAPTVVPSDTGIRSTTPGAEPGGPERQP